MCYGSYILYLSRLLVFRVHHIMGAYEIVVTFRGRGGGEGKDRDNHEFATRKRLCERKLSGIEKKKHSPPAMPSITPDANRENITA